MYLYLYPNSYICIQLDNSKGRRIKTNEPKMKEPKISDQNPISYKL